MPGRPMELDVRRGTMFRRMRELAGLNQKTAGDAIGKSQSWMHRLESGKQKAQENDLRTLIELYRPSPEVREELERLTTLAVAGAPHGVSPNPAFMTMRKECREADEILLLQSERIAMELQSDQYTLLQYEKAGDRFSQEDLLLDKRKRELVITGEDPPLYRVILAQSSLERMPGGSASVKKQQSEHLLGLIEACPRLSLQVLPNDADLAYLDGDMTILKFADKRRNMVYIPYGLDGCLLKDKEKIDERESYWRTVQLAALNKEDSRKFIHHLAH